MAGIDPNRFKPGTKLDEINVNNAAPFIQAGNVLTKGDVCAVRRAWELVLVPEDPADPAAAASTTSSATSPGAASRRKVRSTCSSRCSGPTRTVRLDDVIVDYDFNDNTQVTTLSFLRWNGVDLGREPAAGRHL